MIKKKGRGYVLVSHKGKTLGKHSSRAQALAQERAIKIAEKKRKGG